MSEAYKIYNQKEECFISSEVLEGDTHSFSFPTILRWQQPRKEGCMEKGRRKHLMDSIRHWLSFQSSEAQPLCFPLLFDWSWLSHILS